MSGTLEGSSPHGAMGARQAPPKRARGERAEGDASTPLDCPASFGAILEAFSTIGTGIAVVAIFVRAPMGAPRPEQPPLARLRRCPGPGESGSGPQVRSVLGK